MIFKSSRPGINDPDSALPATALLTGQAVTECQDRQIFGQTLTVQPSAAVTGVADAREAEQLGWEFGNLVRHECSMQRWRAQRVSS